MEVALMITSLMIINMGSCQESCPDGMIFEKQCIKLPSTCSYVTFPQAQEFCNNTNSFLAEISSDVMYNSVYDYLRPHLKDKCTRGSDMYVWLGSTFQVASNPSNEVTLIDGGKLQLANWSPGQPDKSPRLSHWVNMAILLNFNVESSYKGIVNVPPNPPLIDSPIVPLCSYNI